MPGSVARLLPRLRPSGTSPLFLLLLLALLRGPVCGRVPHSVPRTSLPISEADSYLTRFTIPQTYNYSVLLVDPASHMLYVGARDTIFATSLPFSGEKPRRIDWMVPEAHRQNCRKKGKKEDVSSFQQVERLESGRGKCPFEPAQRSAAVMAGWEDPLAKEMATYSRILAWKIHGWRSLVGYSPWGHRVGHD